MSEKIRTMNDAVDAWIQERILSDPVLARQYRDAINDAHRVEDDPNYVPCDYCGELELIVNLTETDDGHLLCDSCFDDWLDEQAEEADDER